SSPPRSSWTTSPESCVTSWCRPCATGTTPSREPPGSRCTRATSAGTSTASSSPTTVRPSASASSTPRDSCGIQKRGRGPTPLSKPSCAPRAPHSPPPAGGAELEEIRAMTDCEYLSISKSTIVRSQRTSRLLPVLRPGNRLLSALAPGLAAALAERLFLTPPRPRRPDAERALLARAQASTLEIGDGARVETCIWGTGPRVLLIHRS